MTDSEPESDFSFTVISVSDFEFFFLRQVFIALSWLFFYSFFLLCIILCCFFFRRSFLCILQDFLPIKPVTAHFYKSICQTIKKNLFLSIFRRNWIIIRFITTISNHAQQFTPKPYSHFFHLLICLLSSSGLLPNQYLKYHWKQP